MCNLWWCQEVLSKNSAHKCIGNKLKNNNNRNLYSTPPLFFFCGVHYYNYLYMLTICMCWHFFKHIKMFLNMAWMPNLLFCCTFFRIGYTSRCSSTITKWDISFEYNEFCYKHISGCNLRLQFKCSNQ